MKAKCPDCESGCSKCDGGFFEARIADGEWYTRLCVECGFENGVCILGTDNKFLGIPSPCIQCDGRVVWKWVEPATDEERSKSRTMGARQAKLPSDTYNRLSQAVDEAMAYERKHEES